MFFREHTDINHHNAALANDYSQYNDHSDLEDSSDDYKNYMTKTLMERGYLFQNSNEIEKIMRSMLDNMFSKEFRDVFLYDKKRNIKDAYIDIDSVKKLKIVGIYDLKSAMVTPNISKYMALFNPSDVDKDKFFEFLEKNKEKM